MICFNSNNRSQNRGCWRARRGHSGVEVMPTWPNKGRFFLLYRHKQNIEHGFVFVLHTRERGLTLMSTTELLKLSGLTGVDLPFDLPGRGGGRACPRLLISSGFKPAVSSVTQPGLLQLDILMPFCEKWIPAGTGLWKAGQPNPADAENTDIITPKPESVNILPNRPWWIVSHKQSDWTKAHSSCANDSHKAAKR